MSGNGIGILLGVGALAVVGLMGLVYLTTEKCPYCPQRNPRDATHCRNCGRALR